jgi:hypothetical protein
VFLGTNSWFLSADSWSFVVVCCGFDLWVADGDDFSAVAMQPQQQRPKKMRILLLRQAPVRFLGKEFWDGENFVGST